VENTEADVVKRFWAWVRANGHPEKGTADFYTLQAAARAIQAGKLDHAHLHIASLESGARGKASRETNPPREPATAVPVAPASHPSPVVGSQPLPSQVPESGPVKRVTPDGRPLPLPTRVVPVAKPVSAATSAFHDALDSTPKPGVPVKKAIDPDTVAAQETLRKDLRDLRRRMKLARRDEQRHPTGATRLFSKFIHPAFHGTSVAFHTLRLLAHAKEQGRGWTGSLAAFARAILGGKRTKRDPYTGDPTNPFGAVGGYFKSLKGVGGIPEHLHDYADKYNWDTADRRHSLDASVYDLIKDTHGDGDAADRAIRTIRARLLTATEDKKREATAKVRAALAKRGHDDLPADWHTEVLNSVERLHQYAMDRQMLKEEAQEKRRAKLTGTKTPQAGNVGWRDWFLGASRAGHGGKTGDPMRLSREAAQSLLAQVLAGRHDLAPILADAMEDTGDGEDRAHHDRETLDHLRQPGPHSIHVHPTTGRIWARRWPDRVHTASTHGDRAAAAVRDAAFGPGGLHVSLYSLSIPDNPIHFTYRLGGYAGHRSSGEPYGWRETHDMGLHYTREDARRHIEHAAAQFPPEEPARLGRFGRFLGGLAGMVAPAAAGAYLANPANPLAPTGAFGGIPGAVAGLTVGRHLGAAVGSHVEDAAVGTAKALWRLLTRRKPKRLASDSYLDRLTGGDKSLDPSTVSVTNRDTKAAGKAPDVADKWLAGNAVRDSLHAALLRNGHDAESASRLASQHADAWRLNGVHDMIASETAAGRHGTAHRIATAGLSRLGLLKEAAEVSDAAAKPKQQLDLFGDPVADAPKKKRKAPAPKLKGGGKVSKNTPELPLGD
jgi:hypothetical protein